MEPRTNSANANDWLEKTKGMTIVAYVESVRTTLAETPHDVTTRIDWSGEPGNATSHPENTFYADLLEAERDIQALVSGLFSEELLVRSAELQALAEAVIQRSQGHEDVDVEQWANRLADDVRETTD